MDQGSQDIALVQRMFDAFVKRDIDRLLGMVDDDIEVRSLMTEAERVHYQRHDGVREWLAAVFEIFPDWTPQPTDMRDLGGAVIVAMDVTATSAGRGVRIDQRFWAAATLAGGKATWFGFFRTEADALAAIDERRAA
jgi:ketosteroid isomerase-like protein